MNSYKPLCILSLVEGLSLLGLLFVGMPLKYGLSLPGPVRILGSLHGVLFLALLTSLFQLLLEGALSRERALRILAWSVAPFGFVAIERMLRTDVGVRERSREAWHEE